MFGDTSIANCMDHLHTWFSCTVCNYQDLRAEGGGHVRDVVKSHTKNVLVDSCGVGITTPQA